MLNYALLFGLTGAPLALPDGKPPTADHAKEQMKEVAGDAEFLRSVPKHFATLQGMDRAKHRVTLLMEGETQPKEWPLAADVEI
jgi:hypothetical protein